MATRKAWHIDLLGAILIMIVFVIVNYVVGFGKFDKWFDQAKAPAMIDEYYRSACPGGQAPINWRCQDGQRL